MLSLALALVPAASVPAHAQPSVGQQRALLSLSVNQADQGEALVLVRDGDALVEVAVLERAGLRNFQGRRETIDGRVFVSLASLGPGITYELDERNLTLKLTATLAHLGSVVLDLRPMPPAFEYARATSAFLNYGLNWSRIGGTDGSIEFGVSVGPALAQNTVSWDRNRGLVRGLSNVVFDQRERLRRWTIGDSLVSAPALGSGLLLGGVHLSREYGLDPYFLQFPTLGLSGSALTPSTVEVYVNDRLVSRQRVAAGSFDLKNVPMPAGNNATRVVVRDAFGREQQMVAPYYLTTTALARGLHEYDYAVGFPRAGGAATNWNYGGLSALARHRYGFTDRTTAGFVAEADGATVMGGPTFNFRLPVGEVELAASASRGRGATGAALVAGYAYMGRPVSVSVRLRSMTADYSTLAPRRPEDRIRAEASGMIGAQVGRRISVSLQQAVASVYAGEPVFRTSLLGSLTVSRRISLFVNASRAREAGAYRTEVFGGIGVALAPRTMSSVWAHSGKDGLGMSADVQRSLPVGNGYGYRVGGALGGASVAEGMFEAQGPYGRYEIAQEVVGGAQSTRASATGGLVAIGGGLHPTRSVNESFALVRVPDVGRVRAYLNNQEVGRTNPRGDVLVPNLLPYYANRVAISDQDVPFDRDIQGVERSIAPPYRGGAVVAFRADLYRSVTGTVSLGVGGQTVLPALGELSVSVGDRPVSSPIGRAGEFYLENVPAGRHPAVVLFKDVACKFTLDVPTSTAPVVRLGIVRCIAPEGK